MKVSATDIASFSYCSLKWMLSRRIKEPSLPEIKAAIKKFNNKKKLTNEEKAVLFFYERILTSYSRKNAGKRAHQKMSVFVRVTPIILLILIAGLIWLIYLVH